MVQVAITKFLFGVMLSLLMWKAFRHPNADDASELTWARAFVVLGLVLAVGISYYRNEPAWYLLGFAIGDAIYVTWLTRRIVKQPT